MTFDKSERAILARLADELIPADETMPSASQAGVAGPWLDAVLVARPDLGEPLKALLGKAATCEPAQFLADLRANDAAAFGLLAELVPAAYFMNSKVRELIRYAGQIAAPIDPRADYLDDDLLESVIRRGPIYRTTPAAEDAE